MVQGRLSTVSIMRRPICSSPQSCLSDSNTPTISALSELKKEAAHAIRASVRPRVPVQRRRADNRVEFDLIRPYGLDGLRQRRKLFRGCRLLPRPALFQHVTALCIPCRKARIPSMICSRFQRWMRSVDFAENRGGDGIQRGNHAVGF